MYYATNQKKSNSNLRIKNILVSCVDPTKILKLYVEEPELFDINTLTDADKTLLLVAHRPLFSKIIDMSEFATTHKVTLFLDNPMHYCGYLDFENLPSKQVNRILNNAPALMYEYPVPLHRISEYYWVKFLRQDEGNYSLCANNLVNIKNKTSIRYIIKKCPLLLIYIDIDIISKTSLNAKEWVLLSNYKEVTNVTDAKFSNEVIEWMREELTIEIMSGESNNTSQLRKGLDSLNEDDQ